MNIAKEKHEEVNSYLRSVRINDHSPFDDAVSDLLNAIKAEQKKIVDTPMSFDIALALLPACLFTNICGHNVFFGQCISANLKHIADMH